MSFFKNIKTENIELKLPFLKDNGFKIFMKREDLIHPIVSGNKFRKLKYNIEKFKKNKNSTLITFGGAYSNHLLAVSYIAKIENINTIAFVRGDELGVLPLNSTLQRCFDNGMEFKFISREKYRFRNDSNFLKNLSSKYNNAFIIPEGGTNDLGILGCEEILTLRDKNFFDVICVPVGSGGTFSGLINSSLIKQKILGFSALTNSNIINVINKFVNKNNWELIDEDLFGGYAKSNQNLIHFINKFYNDSNIKLDPIYNSKMIFKILEIIKQNKWIYGKKILIVNTGGLQSVESFNKTLKNKKCATINYSL